MDAETLVDEVEESKKTELERLGTSKALVAATDGDLDTETVLEAAVETESEAAETFVEWAEDETDDDARGVFEDVADTERGHRDRLVELASDTDYGDDSTPGLHLHLRDIDDTVERVAAGLVGRTLVTDATLKQTVAYFVGQSATSEADLFRDLRRENRELVEDGKHLLDELCDDDEDWEKAREAAEEVVEIAYDEYAETLEGMGINPKPVC
ncbi:MAG: ferritin family protein [Halobacteria archaeon]|nr:ferritin family protein [Halobacteria archaeon]